jgi:hypothetical protein
LNYETPTIVNHGSLTELTAMMNVGGPVDTYAAHPPGHSCPTGPPAANPNAGGAYPDVDPSCVGNGGGIGGGNDFPGNPDFNPANPGQGGIPPGQGGTSPGQSGNTSGQGNH